jgi:hypothetical protein
VNVYPFIEAEGRAARRQQGVRAARGLPGRLLPVGQAFITGYPALNDLTALLQKHSPAQ